MSQPKSYTKKFAISQSSIKDFKESSPLRWYGNWILNKRPNKRSAAIDFGNLLDTLAFNPELFEKRFVVADVTLPSEKVAKIVSEIFDHITGLNDNAKALMEEDPTLKIPTKDYILEENKEAVQRLCKENEYWDKDLERAYKEIVKNGTIYFDFLRGVGSKTVVSPEQVTLAKELKDKLYNDKISRGFFVPKKGCEVIFQQQIHATFEVSGFDNIQVLPVKGMLDIIHINNKRKEIREVDLKFTNDAFKFHEAVRRFDYPMQHSFYEFLIREWIKTFKDGKYKDYSIMSPLNVVIDDTEKIPYLYAYNGSDLHIKRYGIDGTKITGWETILEDIAWHMDTNQWERPRGHYLNGYLTLDIFNKR